MSFSCYNLSISALFLLKLIVPYVDIIRQRKGQNPAKYRETTI